MVTHHSFELMIILIRLIAKKLSSCDGNYSISSLGKTIASHQIIVIRKIHGLAGPQINISQFYAKLLWRVRTINSFNIY